jgi:guanylate kinase
MRGTHQGQQSARTAPTGRTHDCKRPLHHAPHDLLQDGGHPHMKIERRGFVLVLSSPSGAGKTTIARLLAKRDRSLHLSVSVTTRSPRAGEVGGRDYCFIDRSRFDEMVVRGELLEHAIVFGNCYGTPRRPIEEALAAGRDVVGDLDWQGTQQLSENVGQDLVSIFVLPPSRAELEARLRARAQDTEAAVAARMAKAAEEMSHWSEYEYVIVNVDIEDSVAQVQAIVAAERMRRERQLARLGDIYVEDSIAEIRAVRTAEKLRREQQDGLGDFVNHLLAA